MKFWDREIESEPNSVFFVYGPKLSGKSALLLRVAQLLRDTKY